MKIKCSPKYYKVLKVVEFSQYNENLGIVINSIVGYKGGANGYHHLFERVKGMVGYYSNGMTLVTEEEILSKGNKIIPWTPKLEIKIINLNELSKVDQEEFRYEWEKLSKKNYAYLLEHLQIPLFVSIGNHRIPWRLKKKFKKIGINN